MIFNDTYEIKEKIGKGSGGIVYKATHLRLQKDVVIKQMLNGAKSIVDKRQEVDMLKGLKHTYLPQVIDFIEKDGEIYTVMDYVDGTDLETELVNKGKFGQADVVKYGIQLCEAVEYLHKQNPPIIHRDIKPANIMLTKSGDICLIDFNISFLLDAGSSFNAGTRGFASPEQMGEMPRKQLVQKSVAEKTDQTELSAEALNQATSIMNGDTLTELMDEDAATELMASSDIAVKEKHKCEVDVRSDIYSIGATLYCLLTGETPSADFGSIKPLSEYKTNAREGLVHIIEKAMSLNPAKRYQSVSDMLNALQNISKTDRRYRRLKIQRIAATFVFCIGIVGCVLLCQNGYNEMKREREEKYLGFVSEMTELNASGNYDEAIAVADTAIDFMPERISAYYQKALSLYNKSDYEKCLDYVIGIENNSNILLNDDEMIERSNLMMIAANAEYEQEKYDEAIEYFEKSLSYNRENKDCYRDMSISYARTNKLDKAAEILNIAIDAQLSNDQIYLMKGEIAAARGDSEEAVQAFEQSIEESTNDYLIFRALVSLERSVKNDPDGVENSYQRAIDNLTEYQNKVSESYRNVIIELIANEYSYKGMVSGKNTDYLNAVTNYLKIIKNGSMEYVVYKNCIEIALNIEEYSMCREALYAMDKAFPDNYWVSMNYSYCYIGMENQKEQSQRDYTEAYSAYLAAKELYADYIKNGKTDPNMDLLDSYISQLKDAGWIK